VIAGAERHDPATIASPRLRWSPDLPCTALRRPIHGQIDPDVATAIAASLHRRIVAGVAKAVAAVLAESGRIAR